VKIGVYSPLLLIALQLFIHITAGIKSYKYLSKVKTLQNPIHPFSKGGSCLSSIYLYYRQFLEKVVHKMHVDEKKITN